MSININHVTNSLSAYNNTRATVASAASADIWATGNQIDWTGTTTATGFAAAPQAGAERVLITAGAAVFTAGANMLIDGVTSGNLTCAANDTVIVRAVTTTQFKLSRVKYDGTPQVAPASGLVLLSTVTAASSATVDIETTFNSTYDAYMIVLSGVRPATDSVELRAQYKKASAYIATGYTYHTDVSISTATTYVGSSNSAQASMLVANALDNWAGASTHLTMRIDAPSDINLRHIVSWSGGYLRTASADVVTNSGAGMQTTTGALTGIRFFMSSGNISVGKFRLYGIANS